MGRNGPRRSGNRGNPGSIGISSTMYFIVPIVATVALNKQERKSALMAAASSGSCFDPARRVETHSGKDHRLTLVGYDGQLSWPPERHVERTRCDACWTLRPGEPAPDRAIDPAFPGTHHDYACGTVSRCQNSETRMLTLQVNKIASVKPGPGGFPELQASPRELYYKSINKPYTASFSMQKKPLAAISRMCYFLTLGPQPTAYIGQ